MPQNLSGIRVLFIDDDKSIGRLFEKIVEGSGGAFFWAPNIELGLSFLKEKSPHFVFLDVHLKEGNGIDFLKDPEFRLNKGVCRVIMLSGDQNQKTIKESIKLGADAYLVKPLNAKTILDKMREYLNEKIVIKFDTPKKVSAKFSAEVKVLAEDRLIIHSPAKLKAGQEIKLNNNNLLKKHLKFKAKSTSQYIQGGIFESELNITGANFQDIKTFIRGVSSES